MEDRFNRINKEVMSEMSDKFKEIDTKGKNIDSSLAGLQKNFFEKLKIKCKDQYNWIIQNGKINESEGGFEIDIDDTIPGYEKKLEEFYQCSDKYSFGANEFFEKMNRSQQAINYEIGYCIENCFSGPNNNSNSDDIVMKNCVRECYSNATINYSKLFTDIDKKIAEIKDKFI
jgi:hypothetical protein